MSPHQHSIVEKTDQHGQIARYCTICHKEIRDKNRSKLYNGRDWTHDKGKPFTAKERFIGLAFLIIAFLLAAGGYFLNDFSRHYASYGLYFGALLLASYGILFLFGE